MTSAAGPQSSADQAWLPEPVAARIRSTCSRAGFSLLVMGPLLVVLSSVLVLTVPSGNGFLGAVTISGGTAGGSLVLLAGVVLLNARRLVPGRTFQVARARTVRRSIVALWLLSVAVFVVALVGMSGLSDGPTLSALIVPSASGVLTTIAVLVTRSVLTPADSVRA